MKRRRRSIWNSGGGERASLPVIRGVGPRNNIFFVQIFLRETCLLLGWGGVAEKERTCIGFVTRHIPTGPWHKLPI